LGAKVKLMVAQGLQETGCSVHTRGRVHERFTHELCAC
jgi:hypothetical protein